MAALPQFAWRLCLGSHGGSAAIFDSGSAAVRTAILQRFARQFRCDL
jgi:hypothetical protein